jgi:hypothetical protein
MAGHQQRQTRRAGSEPPQCGAGVGQALGHSGAEVVAAAGSDPAFVVPQRETPASVRATATSRVTFSRRHQVFESRSTSPAPGMTTAAATGSGASMNVPARWHPSLSKATSASIASVMVADVNGSAVQVSVEMPCVVWCAHRPHPLPEMWVVGASHPRHAQPVRCKVTRSAPSLTVCRARPDTSECSHRRPRRPRVRRWPAWWRCPR